MADDECGGDYDSHDWQWVDGEHRCVRCGLIEMAGRRLRRHILDGLTERGWHVRPD